MPSHTRPRTARRTSADVAAIATRLADQHRLWQPLVAFDPVSRYYARLAKEPTYEAWLLTWVPGQGTEWHDHGGSAGAFVTVLGELSEEHAVVRADGPPRIQPGARRLSAGTLRTFGTRHVHRVTNLGLQPAVSIHVYAPALVEMSSYAVRGDLLELTGTQQAGVSW